VTPVRTKEYREFCLVCGKDQPDGFHPFCSCGGMVDVAYDLAGASLYESSDSLERFFDLLPLTSKEQLLPVEIEPTPCVHATTLGDELGLSRLYLKDESVLPTGTTKDRMAAVALPYLLEKGVRSFATSSTGNSSTAYARLMPLAPECRLYLFTAESFMDRVKYTDSDQVIHLVLRDATFVDAFEAAKQYADRHGVVSERGFFNPGRREGLKLAYLEAAEQIPHPIDWYVQAVSSAMGVWGTYKGAKELLQLGRTSSLPRLLCVQQETCNPMVRAFEAGSPKILPEHIIERPTGIASAILRGNPIGAYPYVFKIVTESGGRLVAVSETEIREARSMIEELEGLSPCFSSAAAFAGVVRLARAGAMPPDHVILVNLTGSDRQKTDQVGSHRWMERTPGGWEVVPGDG
jgi:threonine synthase